MASPSTSASTGVTAKSAADPILRNALRYTISAREYSLLHKYVISRSRALKKRAPTVDSVQKMMDGGSSGGSQGGGVGKGDKAKGKRRASVAGGGGVPAKGNNTGGADDYNARAVRHSLRVFVATGALMKLWDIISARLLAQKQE